MKIPPRKWNVFTCSSAQVMVEFIMVFPPFILLVLGIIEFSLLSLAHQNVNYAAFNAARAEIVGMPPKKSAWMTLYMLTPHYVSGISPLDAFKMEYPDWSGAPVTIDNQFDILFDFTFDSPCILEILGVEDSSFTFGRSFTVFDNTVTNMEEFLTAIVRAFTGAAADMINPAIEAYNNKVEEAGYAMHPVIRKLFYAIAFTRTKTTETGTDAVPTVNVAVTYYYVLKCPVIRSIVQYIHRNWTDEPAGAIFSGSGAAWSRARRLSDLSGQRFIPITHSCSMGNEKKIGP